MREGRVEQVHPVAPSLVPPQLFRLVSCFEQRGGMRRVEEGILGVVDYDRYGRRDLSDHVLGRARGVPVRRDSSTDQGGEHETPEARVGRLSDAFG